MTPFLTRGQMHILRAMVLREARELGYGKQFHYDNRSQWPRRLKQLDIIAGKLRNQLDET